MAHSHSKYNLPQFIAAKLCITSQTWAFDNPDPALIERMEAQPLHYLKNPKHHGDCIKQPQACQLCLLQEHLEDFYQYTIDEKQFRLDNNLPPRVELNPLHNTKARCQTLYDTIKDAENQLKEIRASCPHTSTIQGLYEFRPGGIYDAIICDDCQHPVKLLVEHIHPVNPTIINAL